VWLAAPEGVYGLNDGLNRPALSSSAPSPEPLAPTCGGRTGAGLPCPIPPTEASGYQFCFRHTPGAEAQVSRWASEASQARDGNVSRRVRRMLKRADLDSLEGVLSTRKALWRCGAAGVIPWTGTASSRRSSRSSPATTSSGSGGGRGRRCRWW
jgi:hypothetical protein